MPTTDTSEKGLETLIYRAMTGLPDPPDAPGALHDPGVPYGGAGWIAGNPHDYDREYAVDLAQLHAFLLATQEETANALALDQDSPTRRRFLARL